VTDSGTAARTASISPSVPAKPSAFSVRASSRTKSAFPRVNSAQARAKAACTSLSSDSVRIDCTASALSDPGRSTRVSGDRAKPFEKVLLRIRLGRTRPHSDRDREILEPAREDVEEAKTRGVCPVRIVYDEKQGLLLTQVHREPEQTVQLGVRDVGGAHGIRRALKHPFCQTARPREEPLGALRRGRAELSFEKLAHDPEGEIALQRSGRGVGDFHAKALRAIPCGAKKRRLSLASGRFEHHQATGAGPRRLEQLLKDREFGIALDQLHRE